MTLKAFVLPTVRKLSENEEYDITLICDYDPDFEKQLPKGVKYIPVHMSRGVSISVFSAIFKLRKIFKEYKFDYIQYSTPNAALAASIASAFTKDPIRLYAQWGIRYVGMNGIKRKIFKTLEKITCKCSTIIRSVSPLNMQLGIEEGLYPKEKVSVIGNGGTVGVDLNIFDIEKKEQLRKLIRKEYSIYDNTYVFGFIGRLNRDKGAEELLSAYKKLCDNEYDVKLFLVGSDEVDDTVDKSVCEWARNSNDVIFTGHFSNTELPKFYALFDCYVHPTYREGFGMVLQEAGAMGNAIITTDIPGAGEVMENDKSCILVRAKDVNELYNAMLRVYDDKSLTAFLGENAYTRTKTFYSRDVMVGNIIDDIKSILGSELNESEINVSSV